MAIANTIAQAGIGAGRNIQNTVGNGLVRYENQKRYEAERLAGEKAAMMEQNRYNTEQGRLDKAEGVAAKKTQFETNKYNDTQSQNFANQAYQVMQRMEGRTPAEQQQAYAAILQFGTQKGFNGLPSEYSPDVLNQLQMAGMNSIKRPDTFSMMTDEQAAEAGLSPGKKYQQNSVTGKISPLASNGITIQTGGKGQSKFDEARGTALATDYGKVETAGYDAAEQQETLNVLSNIDLNTGWGAEARLGFGRAVAAIWGEDVAENIIGIDVTAAQAFGSVQAKMINSVLNLAKGPQTNDDAKRAQSQLQRLGNTPAANDWILAYMTAINYRKMEQAEFYRNYEEKNPGSERGVYKAWSKFKDETPMLSDTQRTENGAPLFFHQFSADVKALNPGATQEQIIKAWRKQEKGSK